MLLIEEFSHQGVEVVFIKSPKADTPEDELLLQFKGMIAEYERALITERSRRGKRFRAKSGLVNVISGAPYGYHYVKKTEISSAYYEIIEEEAKVVGEIYRLYTEELVSIGEITRRLNLQGVATVKASHPGRGQRFGQFFEILLILAKPAMEKPKELPARKLLVYCAKEVAIHQGRVLTGKDRDKNGQKLLFLSS